MTVATLSFAQPVAGPAYDHTRPETKQPWLDARFGGITATEMRRWNQPSERRKIITEKVTRADEAPGRMARYYAHGNLREPMIAAWVQATYGITPSNRLYSHADNPRFMATPDGLNLDWTGEYPAGTSEAILLEIKTSVDDLTPGPVDAHGTLISLTPGTAFAKIGYYRQIQWQMFVMNAASTLFVWELRTREVDPETGTFMPDGPPNPVWIPRDQPFIDVLVAEAEEALTMIDAARSGLDLDALPMASDLPSEHAALVAEYLRALDAEKIAAAAKAKAFSALKALYLTDDAVDRSIDAGFALVTVSTSPSKTGTVFRESVAREAAPAYWRAHDQRVAKFTDVETYPGRQSLTITARKPGA